MGFYPSLIMAAPSSLPSRLICFIVSSIVNIVTLTPTTPHPTKLLSHDITIEFDDQSPNLPTPRRLTIMPSPATLPIEIIMSIIEAGYHTDSDGPENNSSSFLQQCSLVCRDWAPPAQRMLFQNVKLRSQNAFDSFRAAVDTSTAHGRMLADAVVRLKVWVDSDQPGGLSAQSFARAVALCPNLYELSLSLYGLPPSSRRGGLAASRSPTFNESILSELASVPIVTLQLDNFSEDKHATAQLLGLWPSLKSLSLGGAQRPSTPSSAHSAFSLEELCLNFPTSPSLDFMKWLLHESTDTLRCVSLARVPCSNFLEYLLEAHASTLQSLVLPSFAREHTPAVQKCHQLRELIIENTRMAPEVYKKIQLPHVEHIGLSIDVDTIMQPVLEVIKSGPLLKAVTVHVAGPQPHVLLPALQIACAYRGVDLRMTKDIRTFRVMIRGDPILSATFPRVKSLANLNAMRLR